MITDQLLERAESFMSDAWIVLRDAQREYADPVNAFADFEHAADLVGCSREQALVVFLLKHIRGICSHVRGNALQREGVRGRLIDAVNYLAILEAMLSEHPERLGEPKQPNRYGESAREEAGK